MSAHETLSPDVAAVLQKAGARPWTVYRCEFDREYEPNRACGFNGESLDASYDECHHTLSAADAAAIVLAVNTWAQAREALRAIATGEFDDLDPDDGLHGTSARAVARAALAAMDTLS